MAAAKEKEKEEKQRKIDIEKSGGNEYIGVLQANDNKSAGVEASGIDAAISALDVGGSSEPGKGKNLKALYLAFEEQEIARLKVRFAPALARMRARPGIAHDCSLSPPPFFPLPPSPFVVIT